MAGHIIWIMRRLTRSGSYCRGEEIVVNYALRCNDGQMSRFGAVFIPHILQKCILVLGSIGGLFLRIIPHLLVRVPETSQCPERIKDVC